MMSNTLHIALWSIYSIYAVTVFSLLIRTNTLLKKESRLRHCLNYTNTRDANIFLITHLYGVCFVCIVGLYFTQQSYLKKNNIPVSAVMLIMWMHALFRMVMAVNFYRQIKQNIQIFEDKIDSLLPVCSSVAIPVYTSDTPKNSTLTIYLVDSYV